MLAIASARRGQVDERRQGDHGPAERPQDEQEHGITRSEGEIHRQPHQRELDDHQPEAARPEKARELRRGRTGTLRSKKGTNAGGKEKHRRANVGDPAREEEERRRAREIFRREGHGPGVKEVARVVERHDDHDGAAKRIDGGEARGGPAHRFDCPSQTSACVMSAFWIGSANVDDNSRFVLCS